ncbi:MerR family transcriptional regulator [Psychrosphaera sp. 1_MG-2023]|nr:MerR family transcriptional regulator [Psychrosphaera sp. 1_MG-2023]MDO6717952.1 MerR family transcriptional regulator [Psychrosphaera sp. 1_MG-2023]
MKVSELASLLNISADTVRFYTREKLLKPTKSSNGYKYYSPQDVSQLKFILSARSLGFTISDIKNILIEAKQGKTACPMVREIIKQRLAKTEKQFQAMLALRQKMTDTLSLWEKMDDRCPTSDMVCHLIGHAGMSKPEEVTLAGIETSNHNSCPQKTGPNTLGGETHDKE